MDGRSSIGGSWDPLITAFLTGRGAPSPRISAARRRVIGVSAGRSTTERGDGIVGRYEEARFADAPAAGTRTASTTVSRPRAATLIGRIAAALSTTTT
jgi:hypothetical protein